MKSSLLIAAVSLASAAAASNNPAIVARDLSSFGGWALIPNPTCPSGTTTCGTNFCCPTGTTCSTKDNAGQPVCCPTSADCYNTVAALNSCADNSWDLYKFASYFCCTNDTVGTYSSAGTQCLAKSLPLPSSITLTILSQATGSPSSIPSKSVSGAAAGHTTAPGSSNSQTTGTSGSGGSSNSTTSTTIPQNAIIAIAVLAGIVALLVAFLIYRFRRRKSRRNQQFYPVATASPTMRPAASPAMYPVAPMTTSSQTPPPAWTYKAPTPMAHEVSGQAAAATRPAPPAAHELSGHGAPGQQVYEADPVHRVELQ